jgi:hypothetical protein
LLNNFSCTCIKPKLFRNKFVFKGEVIIKITCLCAGEFLQVLNQKLGDGTLEEKTIAATMVWALVANNQKGKLVIKCSGIDVKLQEVLNQLRLLSSTEDVENDERIRIIGYVLQIIHAENSAARKR